MKILALDHSVISYIAWMRMHSANYEPQTALEPVEFARNFAEIMLYIKTLIEPDKIFVLVDCDSAETWRHDIYRSYYSLTAPRPKVEIWTDDKFIDKYEREGYYINFDGKKYSINYNQELNRYLSKKLTKADNVEMLGRIGDESWKQISNVADITEDAAGVIDDLLPGYKKGRKVGRWDYETPKDEFKERAKKIAYTFAPLVGASVIGVPRAEADDLAYCLCRWADARSIEKGPGALNPEIVFATTDSDWQQLAARRPWVSFYDPGKHEMVDLQPAEYAEKFWVKVLGGDSSDSIPGVFALGGKATLGATKAAKLVTGAGISKMPEFVKAEIEPDSLSRNLKLISLKQIPREIAVQAHAAIVAPHVVDPVYGWGDFHLGEAAKTQVIADAQRDRVKHRRAAE